MDGRFNEIEQLFIRDILDQHGEYLLDILTEGIETKQLIVTGDLLDSISYHVEKSGNDFHLKFSFLSYGRFIEINYHKKKASLNTMQALNRANQGLWGKQKSLEDRANRRPKRKNTLWYTKNVYGAQNRLIGRLSNELTSDEIARLKGILEYQQSIGNSAAFYTSTKTSYR